MCIYATEPVPPIQPAAVQRQIVRPAQILHLALCLLVLAGLACLGLGSFIVPRLARLALAILVLAGLVYLTGG